MKHLASARLVMAKCCKLASLTHQSSLFKGDFQRAYGSGRSIPDANATRWSSLFHQLSAVSNLDQSKLKQLLFSSSHANLVLTQKELDSLRELITILEPVAEVTDLVQGDKFPTLGCVVPSVVSLRKIFTSLSRSVQYHKACVDSLLESLDARFEGMLNRLRILPVATAHEADAAVPSPVQFDLLPYGRFVYVMAAVLDPHYNWIWLDADHPGTSDDKLNLRTSIIGSLLV
jgi:hypothetical protein